MLEEVMHLLGGDNETMAQRQEKIHGWMGKGFEIYNGMGKKAAGDGKETGVGKMLS
jgi:hypothetical protein